MAHTQHETLPALLTERLHLVHVVPDMAEQHARFFARNSEFFAPWDPPRPRGFETAAHWQQQLQQAVADFHAGASVRFALFDRIADDAGRAGPAPEAPLLGRVNFTQIARGWFQSCMLGYQIDRSAEGRGLMREALAASIGYMFGPQALHRIQANYRPENERSARLLDRLGFRREGYAPEYLFIDGAWRDHVMTALLNKEEGRGDG